MHQQSSVNLWDMLKMENKNDNKKNKKCPLWSFWFIFGVSLVCAVNMCLASLVKS